MCLPDGGDGCMSMHKFYCSHEISTCYSWIVKECNINFLALYKRHNGGKYKLLSTKTSWYAKFIIWTCIDMWIGIAKIKERRKQIEYIYKFYLCNTLPQLSSWAKRLIRFFWMTKRQICRRCSLNSLSIIMLIVLMTLSVLFLQPTKVSFENISSNWSIQ